MYRAGLLAVLLLAVAAVANVTLTCTVESSSTADTTDDISVSFKFESIAPVFPDKGIRVTNNLIYSPVDSARWDRQLEFRVILEHYAPNQNWRIDKYKCVYNNSGNVQVRYYDVLAQKPQRKKTTITFTVPDTAVEHSGSASVKVSKPLSGTYCSAPPTVNSWPNCPTASIDPNKVTVEPPEWRALQVNGRRPGDVVKAYGVNATIPKPWEYSIKPDVETFSYVEIDGSRYSPDVRGAAVKSSVYLYMVGMPKRWGEVKVKGAQSPLYVVKYVHSWSDPVTFCRPPACVVLARGTVYPREWCENTPYASVVAVQSGVTMTERAWFSQYVISQNSIRLPLGSVMEQTVLVTWSTGVSGILVKWDKVYPRVINSPTYYERLGENGKLVADSGDRTLKIAFAVDGSTASIELGVYSWPIPYLEGTIPVEAHGYGTAVQCVRSYGGRRYTVMEPVSVYAEHWITPAMYSYYNDLTGGRHPDLLHFIYGEPTTYYRGSETIVETGMVSVRTDRRYEQTTADAAGSRMLYYVTGKLPTDTMALFVIPISQSVGSGTSGTTDEVISWLVFLVPTAACRSMFCTSLSPELIGPLLPSFGDKALPNFGYSIMLMYINRTGRHRVKIYVEDGYVISSGPPINVSRAQNYKLVEIDKEWRPFEAVIVGPGWWVPYRRLGPCNTMPISVSTIYATPDRLGPVKIIVEDNGRNSTYTFNVTDKVMYRITTRTPAPESITGTPFNMTAYVTLGGVPYFHYIYGFGEGGRLSPPACASTLNIAFPASQLYVSGDFWGSFGLAHMPLRPVQIQYIYTKPRLELAEPWRGLVRVRADGPVSGFAFYAQRGGTWVKIGEAAGSCLLINASRLFPWDPILVLPLVGQELDAAPGSTVAIWRPETALLFKTWADVVGYPKGARSVLVVVRRC